MSKWRIGASFGLCVATGAAAWGVHSGGAWADNTSDATVAVGGKVVAALEIETVNNVELGALVANSSGETGTPTVDMNVNSDGTFGLVYSPQTVAPPGTADPDNGPGANNNGPTASPGKLSVTGEPGFSFTVSSDPGSLQDAASEVTFALLNVPTGLVLDADGERDIYLGGRMSINDPSPTIEPKTTDGFFTITVTYD